MPRNHVPPYEHLLRALNSELHVWLVCTNAVHDRAHLGRCLAVLSSDERERAASFKFERDRHLFIVAHALVRTTLSHYVDVIPSEWAFRRSEYGRPEIANSEASLGLRFNLSHTRGLAACAVTQALEIGVDVEEIRGTDFFGLARDSFSADEVSFLAGIPGEEQQHTFFRHWTLKEAYIKARGIGLSIPTASFTLALGPDDGASILFDRELDDDPRDWQLFSGRPSPAHALGVALRRGRDRDRKVVLRWSTPFRA